MRFSRFEPRGRLKQQKYVFRRPFFQQVATAIRQKQPTATPISAARPDKPPSEAAGIPPSKVRSLSAKAYRQIRVTCIWKAFNIRLPTNKAGLPTGSVCPPATAATEIATRSGINTRNIQITDEAGQLARIGRTAKKPKRVSTPASTPKLQPNIQVV